MLVVMENRYIALFLQLPLYLKAPGGGDILKVHSSEASAYLIDGLHDGVHILALYAERERVNSAEGLEQHALALHDRHARLRADVPKAQDRAAVSDHQAQVVASCQGIALFYVLLDLQARLGNARRICERKVLPCLHGNCCNYLDLTLHLLVQLQ